MVDFICLGGKKCGTTWLYNQLSKNKNINPSKIKEPNYFDSNSKSLSWYLSLWNDHKKGLKFECSARYIYKKKTIENIHIRYPDCKFILLVRDHLDRSVSHFNLLSRDKKVTNYEEFIEQNYENIINKSLIYPQLKALDESGVLSQTIIINFKNINLNPEKILIDLQKFLGVKLDFYSDIDTGKGYLPKSKLLEKIKYNASELVIKNFSSSPKEFFIFRLLDRIYKKFLTKKNLPDLELKKLIKNKFGEIFIDDEQQIKKYYNLRI